MPVAALKPTAATASGTKGIKRSAPIGEEPTSKRARVESVTRVFAADNNQGQSVRNRKGARNKNSTMRDLLTQSRNAMITGRSSGSTTPKGSSARSVSRTGSMSSKGPASHSSWTSANFSDTTTEMDIDRGKMFSLIELNPSAPKVRTWSTISTMHCALTSINSVNVLSHRKRSTRTRPSPISAPDHATSPLHSVSQKLTLTHKLGTTRAFNVEISRDDLSMRLASRAATPSGAEPQSQGPPRVPFIKPSFQTPHLSRSNYPPLHFDSHQAAFDANQPESTLPEIRSEATVIVTAPTANAPRCYGPLSNKGHSSLAGMSLESGVSAASRHVGKKVQQLRVEGSSMPSWLIETLSTLPSRYPLAIAPSVKSATSNNDSGDSREGSTLSSFHASASSLEYAKRKVTHSHDKFHQINQPMAAAETSMTLARSRKEEVTSFAFAPPPISPLQKLYTVTPRLDDHDFATSTPPRRAKVYSSAHSRQSNQLKVSENHPSDYTNSSLFDTSIAPILLSGQANASNRPNTPYSYFTASPPDTGFTLGSNVSAEMQSTIPLHKSLDHSASKEQAQHSTLLATPSSVDPFGATWAALQSSKSEITFPILRHFNQRRFFFADSQSNKPNTQPASYSSKNATTFSGVSTSHLFSDSLTGALHMPQHAWSPSFPEAKLPNHRHALPPPKSQLRNNFLGAENPLVTPAAIDAATAAADQNPACRDVSDALNAADASIHVRFRIPTRSSSLSFSDRGHPRFVDGAEKAWLSPLEPSADYASDEHALTDEMCFFYDEHPSAEHMVLMDDKSRSQDNYHGGDASRFVQLADEASVEKTLGNRSRQGDISVNSNDFKSAIVLAGIGTEDELFRLLEADAGEEVEMGDIGQPVNGEWQASQEQPPAVQIAEDQNDSHDSISSWGDNDV